MRRRNKRTLWKYCISLSIILACVIALKMSHGSRFFKKYVCNPIPKSVRNIEAHGEGEFLSSIFGRKYLMHFKINKADVGRILNLRKSRRFRQVGWVSHSNGSIYWGDVPPWERQNQSEFTPMVHYEYEYEGLSLYELYDGRPGPEWFRPNDWESPKVYVFKERVGHYQEHIQILIYNEEADEAYCVEHQEGCR